MKQYFGVFIKGIICYNTFMRAIKVRTREASEMNYNFLDKKNYQNIPIIKIDSNENHLPFWIARLSEGNKTLHRHEYIQIIYVSKGKLTHVINNNSFEVIKGDIFVIPPYVPHTIFSCDGQPFEIIEYEFVPEFINEKFSAKFEDSSFFDFAYLEPFLVVEQQLKPRLNLSGTLQLTVEKILGQIIEEYQTRNRDFELIIKALTMQLLILVGREFKKDINANQSSCIFLKHQEALSKAIHYIEENSGESISFSDVARVALLSPSYFRYLFRQMTDKTFTEYLNDIRIRKAIDLLKSHPESHVLDVCYEVGFNNINHFNRIFKQITGVSPKNYKTRGSSFTEKK